MILPKIILVGGKKLSGKDYLCDVLSKNEGYTKIHIAEPWTRKWWAENIGTDYDKCYEQDKHKYREQQQKDSQENRDRDPGVLVRLLEPRIKQLQQQGKDKIAVTGIRFENEALYGIYSGYFVIKVWCKDEERKRRFERSGQSLDLFDDPFESQIETLPCHLEIESPQLDDVYLALVSSSYQYMCKLTGLNSPLSYTPMREAYWEYILGDHYGRLG